MIMESPPQTDDSADLQHLLRPMWRRRWIIAVAVIVATVATFLYYASQPKEYTASASVYLRAQGLAASVFGAGSTPGSDRNTTNQSRLIQSRVIIAGAAEQLGLPPSEVAAAVTASPASGADFLTVSATSREPRRAAQMANRVTETYIEQRNRLQTAEVDEAIAATQAQLDRMPDRQLRASDPRDARRRTLEERLERLETLKALPAGDIAITQRATTPSAPSAPRPARSAAFAFVLSLLMACGLALLFDRFDRRVKRLEDVGDLYGLPVLGAIPHVDVEKKGNQVIAMPPVFRDPLRALKTSLQLAAVDRPLRTLLVTSAVSGEGKSTLVRNLAVVYREWGLRVAVVEVDLRRPSMARMFNVDGEVGLVEVLAGQARLEDALQPADVQVEGLELLAHVQQKGEGDPMAELALTGSSGEGSTTATEQRDATGRTIDRTGVRVLTAGSTPANPEPLLATQRLATLIGELGEHHDIVLLDAPPLLAVSDAIPLLSRVDGVLLLTRHGVTPKEAGAQVRDLLARVRDANPLGVVVNDFPASELHSAYGYYSDSRD
jgi:polysaccharide biosynthesis transport protein